ncbi:MAG: ribonuclease HII [Bacteroidetes bacterium]|nr:ribonuclease HII [Bacteroidota bacterium]MDA1334180.1 ribonuclease HII [Bacteroidota bacterium]
MKSPEGQSELFATAADDDLAFERQVWSSGMLHVAGVDEAGRGCLAGPVVAAAVILPRGVRIDGVTDSKVLSAQRRTELAVHIKERAVAWAVGSCSPVEIDELNILWAAMEAMRRAVSELSIPADHVLIDGNTAIPNLDLPSRPIIKGDSRSHTIAAASILAKTHRDELMQALHGLHPHFGWDSNMGYPTEAHYAGLAKVGPTTYHRQSFRLAR